MAIDTKLIDELLAKHGDGHALPPNGKSFSRILLDLGGDSVIVIPRDAEGRYLLNRQIRPGVPAPQLEFVSVASTPKNRRS